MKTHSNSIKLLAVLCTLAMLASLMVSFGISASAALTDKGSCGFEDGQKYGPSNNRTWGTDSTASNNTVRQANDGSGTFSMTKEKKTGLGQGGSDYVAVAKYEDNLASATGTISPAVSGLMRDPAGARLSTPTIDTLVKYSKNKDNYRISFYYKVVNLPEGTDADIKFIVASRNWSYKAGGRDYGSSGGVFTAATITSSTATGQWIHATAYIKNTTTADQAVHVMVVPTDNRYRSGMEIWLDSFNISIIPDSDKAVMTLDYNDNGATASTETARGYAGDPISSLPTPTRDGYDFMGWYTAAEGGDKVTTWQADGTTIYAHWEKPAGTTYTVTCNAVGIGTTVVTATPGTLISSKVSDPVRAGYTFDGWFSDPACSNKVTVVPDGDITLYAGWTAQTKDIETFEDYGKTAPTLLDLNFDSAGASTYYGDVNNHTDKHTDADASIVDIGGNKVMQLTYGGGTTTVRCGFRLTNNAGESITAKSGTVYSVTFKYKVVSAPMDGAITLINASLPWSKDGTPNPGTTLMEDMVSFPAGTTTDWVTASHVFEANGSGLHIALTMPKDAKRDGAVVYIDDVTVATRVKTAAEFTHYGTASVTAEQNHTAGGSRAAKLTANNTSVQQTARVVFSNQIGNVKLAVGKKYMATVWVYAPTAVTGAKVRFINDYDLSDMATAYPGKLQDETTLDLPAGKWVRVQKLFTLNAINGETEAYLSAGVCVPDSATVYLDDFSVVEYVTDMTAITGYEQFDAITYPAGMVNGVNGNDAGRTVSTAQNHTSGGNKSLALNVNSAVAAQVARTVVFIDRENFRAVVGQGYFVSFWAFSETDVDMHFAIGSTGDLTVTDTSVQKDIEGDSKKTVSLTAGEWKQVNLLAPQITGAGATEPYLTINAWFDGASATNAKTVYLDDVGVIEYTEYEMDSDIQSFESTPIDADISLNNSIFASLDENHTAGGLLSAKVVANTSVGGTRPQMIVTNGDGNQISVEAGKKYEVTFWAYTDEADVFLRYWFTANDTAVAFTSTDQKNEGLLYESLDTALKSGTWKKFTTTIDSAAYSGLLRLGVTTTTASPTNTQIVYIDDIRVKNIKDITYDPAATVQDFENFQLDDGMGNQGDKKFILNGDGQISRKFNHTPGTGNEQSLQLYTKTWDGANRNQFLFVDPKNGNFLELEKGVGYTVSFWVYMSSNDADPDSNGTMRANFWLMTTDDATTRIKDKTTAEYDHGNELIDCDQWVQFSVSLIPRHGKYLMMGITDSTTRESKSTYYIDDIVVEKAKYVTFKYDTNGSKDTLPDTTAIVGEVIPVANRPETDPYREGYEFTGWYFNKDCTPDSLFDIEEDKVQGNDGDVITLYAGWAVWKNQPSSADTTKKEPELVYKNQTVYDRVWIGDDVEDPVIESGDRPEVEATDPVNVSPRKDKKNAEDGVATWLIIVIAAAAVVVVGGGAALTLILLKKSKAKA